MRPILRSVQGWWINLYLVIINSILEISKANFRILTYFIIFISIICFISIKNDDDDEFINISELL